MCVHTQSCTSRYLCVCARMSLRMLACKCTLEKIHLKNSKICQNINNCSSNNKIQSSPVIYLAVVHVEVGTVHWWNDLTGIIKTDGVNGHLAKLWRVQLEALLPQRLALQEVVLLAETRVDINPVGGVLSTATRSVRQKAAEWEGFVMWHHTSTNSVDPNSVKSGTPVQSSIK